MCAFHRIERVIPVENHKLEAHFLTGERRLYDVAALEKDWPVFKDLSTIPGLFALVRVDAGGYGVAWNENLDLSCEEIWQNGTPI
jgi:hypothetical protein